jgi:hydrogenase nickel incorporation protein HypA/HybF
MHEISLVRNIFHTLEAEFPDRINNLRGIYLQVGLLSNVQPVLMQNAFEAVLIDEPRFAQTSLHVEVLPIRVHCTYCDAESEVQQYRFVCAACGKTPVALIQGEELLIAKVEFEQDD